MYIHSALAGSSVAAGASLASSSMSAVWWGIGAFALFAAFLAVLRIVPRREA